MRRERFSVLLLSLCCGLLEAQSVDHLISTLQEKYASLEKRLDSSENEVLHLKSLMIAGQSTVAFSAFLTSGAAGSVGEALGPFPQRTTVPYNKVFANVGNRYNPVTGLFTAMVKGMYYFSFTMCTPGIPNTQMCLWKNKEVMACVWAVKNSNSGSEMGSNGAVIPMVVGDTAYVTLEPNRTVYVSTAPYTTFGGFLLSPQ